MVLLLENGFLFSIKKKISKYIFIHNVIFMYLFKIDKFLTSKSVET